MHRFRWHFLAIAAFSVGAFYALVNTQPRFDFPQLFKLDGIEGRLSGTFRGEYRSGNTGAITFRMVDAVFEFDEQCVIIPTAVNCHISKPSLLPEPEQTYSTVGKFSISQIDITPIFKGADLHPESSSRNTSKLAGRLQRQIRDGLKASLPPRHAAIVTGFILGDTSSINLEDRRLFKETGISHLLAVSGQHLMVLVMLLAAIFHWLKIPPISRSILTATILGVYAMTTAGSPSVWRALTMYLCVATILHLESNPSPIRPVAFAAFILLLHDPAIFSNAAFQLSFTAVIGILFLRRPFEQLFAKLYFPVFLSRYLSVSLAASIATLPMTALLFGTMSLSALVVNPLILWVFVYVLPVSFLIVLLSAIWPTMTLLIAPALSLVIDGILAFLQKAAAIPGHFFFVGNLSGITIAGCFAILLYIVSLCNLRETELSTLAAIIKTPADPNSEKNGKIRAPEFSGNNGVSRKFEPGIEKPIAPDYRINSPFKNPKVVRDIDTTLLNCRRRPIKSSSNVESELLPISLLSIDNQNLYHQLMDLDYNSLKLEPERLIQAHTYLLALVGGEIINRASYHLSPPPQPGDVKIEYVVRDRYLAISILADALLNSKLLTRATDENFMLIVSRAQAIYGRARNQLERIIVNSDPNKAIDQHLSVRRDLLCWCREFVEFDQEVRRKNHTELRPEQ
ncbi:MAG: ComEC/Rec2 family competence protein [Candidatus Riflebacteria bacterium]|nr:ComEC/Rec2 family competence protein [Candidatus Riflebacteria bacterium]